MTDQRVAEDERTAFFAFDQDNDDDPRNRAARVPTLPAPPTFDAAAGDRTGRWQPVSAGEDDESTRVQPRVADAPTAVLTGQQWAQAHERATATPSDADPQATAVLPIGPASEEARKLDAERAARREAREQALAAPDLRAVKAPEPVVITRRSTDRFLGSFGLFLLRLVVATILGVRGLEMVTNLPAAQAQFATTVIPYPEIAAMVTGWSALAIAVALVFGLLTRVAGLGVALIAGGALVFVQWGNWLPFVQGRSGFLGELELLLTATGLLFLMVGAGGFSLDRSFRKSRERDRHADLAL